MVILAGPNGAGKSTVAGKLLQGPLKVDEFVNADTIAQGLSAFHADRSAVAAGRIMLARLRELAEQRISFGFETTLASRSFLPWLKELIDSGYEFHLVFLWLASAEAAITRVRERVRAGGHFVPDETIRRRYQCGLRNFFVSYRQVATSWQILDNSGRMTLRTIAVGSGNRIDEVLQRAIWNRLETELEDENRKSNR